MTHLIRVIGMNSSGAAYNKITRILVHTVTEANVYTEGTLCGIVLDKPKKRKPKTVQVRVRAKRKAMETILLLSALFLCPRNTNKSSMNAKASGKMLYGYLTIPERKKSAVDA